MKEEEAAKDIFVQRLLFKLGTGERRVTRSVHIVLLKGRKNCLIDTGTAGNFKEILDLCARQGLTVDNLDFVINTHCHADHIGSNLLLRRANPGIVFCAHPLAKPFIEDIDEQYRRRPVPGFHDLVAGPVGIDRLLTDGERVDISLELQILHTPGHSRGSISIFIPDRDLLIIGDAVPGRGDIPIYEDLISLQDSFEKLEQTGAGNVISAFDGYCGGIAGVIENGKRVVNEVQTHISSYYQQRGIKTNEPGLEGTDIEQLCSFVLSGMGFSDTPPLPIITSSIKAHLASR
jgi:hydroxyacylglutathione hydrolase